MELKIGVQHATRELTLESNQSADDLQKAISGALGNEDGLLVLSDEKGRTIYIPAAKLAYVEIAGDTGRRVGFAAY